MLHFGERYLPFPVEILSHNPLKPLCLSELQSERHQAFKLNEN